MPVKLSTLKPNPKNPRFIRDQRFQDLVKSIRDFPQGLAKNPIKIYGEDRLIIAGNMRYKSLLHLGYKEVPEEWILDTSEFTEEERERFIIVDNVSFGENDWQQLNSDDWDMNKLEEWGLEVKNHIAKKPDATEDNYEIPTDIKTDIKPGDIIEIGNHILICGDCTDLNVWDKLRIGKKNVCFTSPPYNIGKEGLVLRTKTLININSNYREGKSLYDDYDDSKSHEDYEALLNISLDNALRSTDAVIFNVQSLALNKMPLIDWLFRNKKSFTDIIIWDKGNATPNGLNKGMMTSIFEFLYVFCNREKNLRKIPLASWRGNMTNIYRGAGQAGFNESVDYHKATFPVHLANFILNHLMDESEGIVDCFMGTGTSMVAAHQLEKKAFGIELNPKYCQIIIDRMEKLDPSIVIKKIE